MTDTTGNEHLLEAFERQADGSWVCRQPAVIATPAGDLAIEPGMTFAFGERHSNLDVAEYLERLGVQFGS